MSQLYPFHIIYGPHTCKLSHAPDYKVEERLRELLAYEPKDREYIPPRYGKGGVRLPPPDPRKYLYNRRTREFPTGLMPKVLQALGPVALMHEPQFLRPQPWKLGAEAIARGIQPRHYQSTGCEVMTTAGRGVGIYPTGTGKTLCVSLLMSSYPDAIGLCTTPNKRLLHQNRSEIEFFLGEKVGILGDSECDLDARVVVATIQSLVSRIEADDPLVLDFLRRTRVWVSDESHGAAADSYRTLSKALPQAFNRFGLTASWMREDGCELVMEGVLGDVVYRYTYEEAFNEGFLTPIRVWCKKYPIAAPRHKRKPPFSAYYKEWISENDGRNLQIALDAADFIENGMGPCLVMVRYIEQGKRLAQMMNCGFVNGEQNTGAVDEQLAAFLAQGKHALLIGSGILNVGVNLRELRSGINAAAGDSRIDAIQKPGRGLRLHDTKTHFDYLDYIDQDPNYLQSHGSSRRFTYKEHFPGRVHDIPLNMAVSEAIASLGRPRAENF